MFLLPNLSACTLLSQGRGACRTRMASTLLRQPRSPTASKPSPLLLPRCSPHFPHTRSKSKTGSPLLGGVAGCATGSARPCKRPSSGAGFQASTLYFELGCLLLRPTIAIIGTKVPGSYVPTFCYVVRYGHIVRDTYIGPSSWLGESLAPIGPGLCELRRTPLPRS